MATELLQEFEGAGTTVMLKGRYAELPSITAVGMNVLAPVSQSGRLMLAGSDGFKGFKTGEYTVRKPDERVRAMGDRSVDNVSAGRKQTRELSLLEVCNRSNTSLKQSCANADLIVIHSKEIDDAGEANVGIATFETWLQQIKSAWNHLKSIGVNEFVFTADHGFLLQDQTTQIEKYQNATRRYFLSQEPRSEDKIATVSLKALKYDGQEGYLLFRKDTAVFATGNPSATFVHGGNSLQERVIPVLTVSHRHQSSLAMVKYLIEATPERELLGFSRIRLRVKPAPVAQGVLSFVAARSINLVLRVPDRADIQITLKDAAGAEVKNQQLRLAVEGDWVEVLFDNDLHFYKFDDVYRKVVQELATSSCSRGALSDIIDRWIARVEDALIAAGADEDSAEFDALVEQRLEEELVSMTGGKAPEDMARVLRTVFALKQKGNIAEASAILSWLSGSENVAASAKKVADIKGDIGSREALDYLQGILEIIKAAGYRGLVIVIDEAETILRMRHDVRGKSLNGIRQICDAADRYSGLLWIFTGTPEFFDANRGVAGLQPLHERIKFLTSGGFAAPRQPQLELKPFDTSRLQEVALKLRELYPTAERTGLTSKVTSEFIERLVAKVTAGFKGDVGVVPRQFLRHFVNVLDLAAEHDEFEPMAAEGFEPKDLNEDEYRIREGRPYSDEEPEALKGYAGVEF